MQLKNLSSFSEYYKRYIGSENSEYLIYMFLTARTFFEWIKVYRNLYWTMNRKDCSDPNTIKELKDVSLRVLVGLSPSLEILKDELMSHQDIDSISDIRPLKGEEMEGYLLRLSLEHFS